MEENRRQGVIKDSMNVKRRRRRKQHTPQREKHSKAIHDQESRKAQPKRGIVKGRLGEPLKC